MGRLLRIADFVYEPKAAASSSLAAYFHPGAFTGSSFELFARPGSNHFTADDVVAVSMLSVNIPAKVSRWILGEGAPEVSELLDEIVPSSRIEDSDMDLSSRGPAHKLWTLIRRPGSPWGMGETKTSKLLATKRPNLFPLFDRHVAEALRITAFEYWTPWQEFMRSTEGRRCADTVSGLAGDLGIEGVSVLRLFDVIVWMREHGHRSITAEEVARERMIKVTYAPPSS